MQVPPEQNRHMAMLRAALPYVMPDSRRAIEVVLQADALIHTARGMQAQDDYGLEAAEFQLDGEGNSAPAPHKPDPENMLLSIQEYCTPRESDLIQTLLNVLQANRLFRNYREFQRTHPVNNSELSAAQTGNSNNQLMEFLLTQLAPEQKSTFEQLQRIMYNERCQTPERTPYDTTTPMAES